MVFVEFKMYVIIFDFLGSSEVRSPRPKEVMYRVGQVIRHKKWGYRGVIVGWDATARVRMSQLLAYMDTSTFNGSIMFINKVKLK